MYGGLPGDHFLTDSEARSFLVLLTRVKGMKLRPDYPSGVVMFSNDRSLDRDQELLHAWTLPIPPAFPRAWHSP